MKKAITLLTLAVVLSLPISAQANGLRRSRPVVSYYYPAYYYPANYYSTYFYPAYAPVVSYYYYPAPVYVVPAAQACVPTVQDQPLLPNYTPPSTQPPPLLREYAPPTPAPPSETPKPRTSLLVPTSAAESSHYYDAYPAAPRDSFRPVSTRAEVGFWNLTDRDLTLRVEGQPMYLGRGKSVSFQLSRDFVWQIDGREPERQTLQPDQSGLEILIRK